MLNNKGIIFIKFDTIGGITLDRVISFAKYPTKILPKANKSKGNVDMINTIFTWSDLMPAYCLVVIINYATNHDAILRLLLSWDRGSFCYCLYFCFYFFRALRDIRLRLRKCCGSNESTLLPVLLRPISKWQILPMLFLPIQGTSNIHIAASKKENAIHSASDAENHIGGPAPLMEGFGNDYYMTSLNYGSVNDGALYQPTLEQKLKKQYWKTKQAVIQKLGKSQDEFVVAGDAEIDTKLEVRV